MSDYLETTRPSDYRTDEAWFCTIGHAQSEWLAWAITKYLQEHGDEWRPVPVEELKKISSSAVWGLSDPNATHAVMKERWLKGLQQVRTEWPGPPELIRAPQATTGLQLRYPNGRIIEAGYVLTEEQIDDIKERWGMT